MISDLDGFTGLFSVPGLCCWQGYITHDNDAEFAKLELLNRSCQKTAYPTMPRAGVI
jgi:hypothetical protein